MSGIPSDSRLVSAYAYSNNSGVAANNPAATSEPTWFDRFSEHTGVANFVYVNGNPNGGASSSIQPTYTVPINTSDTFELNALNGSWTNDLCSFTLEFLNSSGSVVCVVHSPGLGSYSHQLRYGVSKTSYATAPQSGYAWTHGILTFTSTHVVFTNTRASNFNGSFSFACAADTITHMRVSDLAVRSTYWGNASAYVMMRRIEYGLPQTIDAITSGQLIPSPVSQLLVANWPLVGAETSGALVPTGFLTINNPQITEGLLSGTLTPTGFLTVNNPQIIDGLLSGAMSPSGSVLVSSYWLIEAVASGRLSPSEAAHILIDNLDPGAMEFAQIVGELELYSEVIRAAQLAGKIDLFGTMSVTPEHEAQVAGVLQLIDGEASFCGCGNG